MPSLEIYKVIFIIEIIIAEFLLTIHLKKRSGSFAVRVLTL